jgi:flagellar biosynthesis protein FliR
MGRGASRRRIRRQGSGRRDNAVWTAAPCVTPDEERMLVLPAPLEALVLIFIRTATMLLSAPWFGNRSVPPQLKVGLMALISFLLFPIVDHRSLTLPQGLIPWALAIGGEFLLGLTIGLIVRFVFAAVSMAGQLIGLEVGLSMPAVFNPEFDEQSTVLHTLTDMVTLLIFLSTDAHHLLLRGLAHSFHVVPLLGWDFGGSSVEAIARLSAELWHIALRIGAPLLAAQFLSKIVLALLARAAPQMNIFTVGFPLQIGSGLLMLGLMLPMFAALLEEIFGEMGLEVAGILSLLRR